LIVTQQSPLVAEGLMAWASGDLDRLAELLDPEVELLAAEPGPWDCHGRDAVIALLTRRRAEGVPLPDVRIDDIDEHTIVISHGDPAGRAESVGATVATIHDGTVTRMQQYPDRAAALAAIG
jgi:ketosteroid isomerase-like protein